MQTYALHIELHLLRSFVTAVRLGSFNAAAKELSYTGPAVSQHVTTLERELGVELLTRHARGVVPTPAGAVLDERARALITDAQGVVREVQAVAQAPATVRIGSFSTAAQFLLPTVLTEVLTDRPGVEVVLIDREPPDGLDEVVSGELDLLIAHCYPGAEFVVPRPLIAEPLVNDRLVLLVPDGHWASDEVELGDLSNERWISGPPDAQNQMALEWAAHAAGFEPVVAFETTDYAVTTTLVATGLGLAFVPELTLPHELLGVRSVGVAGLGTFEREISVVTRQPIRSPNVAFVLERLRCAAEMSRTRRVGGGGS